MKALLTLGYGEKHLDWCIVTANAQPFSDQDSADPSQAAVSGLAGTMAKEYPHWNIRMIDTETDGSWLGQRGAQSFCRKKRSNLGVPQSAAV